MVQSLNQTIQAGVMGSPVPGGGAIRTIISPSMCQCHNWVQALWRMVPSRSGLE